VKSCHACGAEWTDKEGPGFSATCEKCGAWLHCCRNCDFYAPGLHNDCRETQADQVGDRQARNLCDWFRLADRQAGAAPGAVQDDRAARARAKLDQLFRKPGGSPG
jgi:hypothetical protein